MRDYIKGFISFSFGTWLRFAISFISAPVISYFIPPEEYGRASMFGIASSVLMLVLIMGTDEAFMRFYHEYEGEKKKDLFVTMMTFIFSNFIISSILIMLFGKQISISLYGKSCSTANIILIMFLFISLFQRLISLTFRMEKRGTTFSLAEVMNSASSFLATLIYILLFKGDFLAILYGSFIGTTISFVYVLSKFDFRYLEGKFHQEILKDLARYGIPYLPTYLFVWVLNTIDRIVLRQYSTFSEIGIYSTAFKLVSLTQIVTVGFFNYWFPLAYEVYEKNIKDLSFFKKANQFTSFVMLLLGATLLMFKDMIFSLFSKNYHEAAYVAPFLILIPVTSIIHQTVVIGINFRKKPYLHILMAAVSAIANYLGNIVLIPFFGAKGAAISTGLSHIILYLLGFWLSEKTFYIGFEKKRPFIGLILLVLQSTIGTMSSVKWFLNVLTGIAVTIVLTKIYRDEFQTLIFENLLPAAKERFFMRHC